MLPMLAFLAFALFNWLSGIREIWFRNVRTGQFEFLHLCPGRINKQSASENHLLRSRYHFFNGAIAVVVQAVQTDGTSIIAASG